jgi:septum formation protein
LPAPLSYGQHRERNAVEKLILASQSPRRRQLLEEAGFSLVVVPADIDETRRPGESPVQLVERLALGKAEATRRALGGNAPASALVAADTIVWTDNGEVLGKPKDRQHAARMLQDLSGRTHHVSTGVCAMTLTPAAEINAKSSFVETADVTFFELTQKEIETYVASGEPMDKAGGYGIQGLGRLLVKSISGDWFTVVGLPVSRLIRELGLLEGRPGMVADLLGRES